MPKLQLPKSIKTAAESYAKLDRAAKEASNAANRQKTALRNAVKDHWTTAGLPIGSFARSDGFEIRYEATSTEVVDPERVLELFENEEITREQFLRMVNIGKTEAKNVLGGDQVAEFTVTDVGKKLDIRLTSLPVENLDDEYVMENSNVKKRVKRRVFGNKTASAGKPVQSTTSGRKLRRIKTRTKK